MKTNKILSIISVLALFGCKNNDYPVKVDEIVGKRNKNVILESKNEIGKIFIFEVTGKVETSSGYIIRKEIVEAKIIGHKEFAGSVNRIFETKYSNGKRLSFTNNRGKELIISTLDPYWLGVDYDGGLDILTAGYIDGKYISIKDLRKAQSLERYGFRLLEYVAPKI
jgi:hypothetical protein